MSDELFLLGRVLFSLVFIRYGVLHLTKTAGSVQYAAYKKVPQPQAAVIVSGVVQLLAGIAIVLGIWMDLAGICLAVFVLIAAFLFHRYWEEQDPQARAAEMAQFMKNVSLAGGALVIAAVADGAPYAMTDGLF
jgi:uncharacterized membrane protein YphA (DoxX/SURF4 family)